ncbi:MAG: diguanylate cyclase [Hydrogenophilus sp.]|nr:diguanylate cyclase [Hydrogenophilus sp.]
MGERGPLEALLVDPGEASGKFLTRTLERFGLAIYRAHDMTSAVTAAQERGFDVVLTTYILPDGDGVELAERLRPWLREAAPVILVTADATPQLIERAFRTGVTDVFSRDDLGHLENFLHYFLAQGSDAVVGARVLLVEDSNTQQRNVRAMLERRGFVVDVANSVAAARHLLTEQEYELFVIDLVLSDGLSGISLIRQLRRRPEDFVLQPVIVMTGFHDAARKSELYRLGVNDYVLKPPQDVELLARAHNLVLIRRLYQQVEEREQLLRVMAVTDRLTGVANRHAYEEVANRYYERAKHDGRPLGLLVVDIDYFKRINDRYGHARGDEVLVKVARAMSQQVRASDFVARFGGEEFVVLLPNCPIECVARKAETIRATVSQRVFVEGGAVTVSVGGTVVEARSEPLAAAFERADRALLQAKERGRNRVEVVPFSPVEEGRG